MRFDDSPQCMQEIAMRATQLAKSQNIIWHCSHRNP